MTPMLTDLLKRCRFPEGLLQLGVSGGADSTALLALAVHTGQPVEVHHVDHGIRPESDADAELVQRLGERFGVKVLVHVVKVSPGGNLEARARRARYEALPTNCLVGHTMDDLVETSLINQLRGASLDGLTAMKPEKRPLLGLRRSETQRLCAEMNLPTTTDITNHDPQFLRNRIRNELLPMLSELAQRDVVPVLARSLGLFARDARFLAEMADSLDVSDARVVAEAPEALATRALRSWLRSAGGLEHYPPDRATLQRVLEVARGERVATDVGGGFEVRRSRQRLSLRSVNVK